MQVKLKDQYRKAEANDQLSFYRAFKYYQPLYDEETPSECSCNFWLSHYLPCVHIWFDSQFDGNLMNTAQVDLYVDRWIAMDEGIGTCNTTTVHKDYRYGVLPQDDFEDGFVDVERKAPIDRNQHMLLHTLVDGMKEEFYRLAGEAKPRTTKQEFDRYIHFLHDHYNAILAVDLDKITLDHYRDGGGGHTDAAIVGKRQYAADQFRYTVAVILDEDGIDDNALLGTIDDEAGALSVMDETAQYEVDETVQYEVDETVQHEEELGIVHDTATATATATAQHEELGVAEVENITTLFESTVGMAPTQSLAKLHSMFDTTIEPQRPSPAPALARANSSPFHFHAPTTARANSSPFHLYAPTNPSPLRMQSALPLGAEFDYSEFPSQLSQTSLYPAARRGPAAYAVTAGVAQFNAAFGMQVEEETGHIRRITAKPL